LKENQLICLRKITDENHLKKIKVFFEAIQPAPDVKERIKAVSDPEDNKILESAVSSNADYIVTSDKHLLDLNRYGSIQILSPSSFWQRYEEKNEDPWQKWIKDFMVAE
jgi:predicted nucleic acid-binding protein